MVQSDAKVFKKLGITQKFYMPSPSYEAIKGFIIYIENNIDPTDSLDLNLT